MWHKNILGTIGNTPLVELNSIAENVKPTILAKIEFFNPGMSVKDRIGVAMIEDAEKRGELKPGGTIIEATSGNTGMGLVIAAAVKGYHCIVTTTERASREKIDALRAFGAEVIVSPVGLPSEDPRNYVTLAHELNKKTPNSCFPNQYDNEYNWRAHYKSTGPEIWEQTERKITHFVCGMGTCGTITGTGRFLKEKNPDIQVIGVEPEGSIFYDLFYKGEIPATSPYNVEGIGQDVVPGILDLSVVDDVLQCSDNKAFLLSHQISKLEGIFVGGSCGAALFSALKVAETLTKEDLVVVIFPDSGARYLSKFYNDDWMKKNEYQKNDQ